MKKIYLILAFLLQLTLLYPQNVGNVKAEQAGDFIRISYTISDSSPLQLFRVKILCSINGGLNTELRSVTGDVGENITGGKDEYWIVWDVLKDVESLESADFIVRAELINNNLRSGTDELAGSKSGAKQDRSFLIMPLVEMPRLALGASIGYIGKVGVLATYVKDLEHSIPLTIAAPSPENSAKYSRYNIGITYRILNGDDLKIHTLFGLGVGEVYVAFPDWKKSMSPGFEAGVIMFYKKLAFSVTSRNLLTELTEEGEIATTTNFVSVGVGIRF